MIKFENNADAILNLALSSTYKIFKSDNGVNRWSDSLNIKWVLGTYIAACLKDDDQVKCEAEKVLLKRLENEEAGTFIPFLIILLFNITDDISTEMREMCERILKKAVSFNCEPCWDFIGVNDNTPAMIMTCMFLTGDYFKTDECLKIAENRLLQFEEMLNTRTFISEFNSPTYHAVTIAAFAVLAEYSENSSIRKRALICEERLWEMAFKMFHKDMCVMVGPYARAYLGSSYMSHAQMSVLYYIYFGERMKNSPVKAFFGDEKVNNTDEALKVSAMWSEACWLASVKYHCPERLPVDNIIEKYPVLTIGDAQISASADDYIISAEEGDSTEFGRAKLSGEDYGKMMEMLCSSDDIYEYPAGVSKIFSMKNAHYALGTCTKEFHNGIQTDSFHAAVCDRKKAQSQNDVTAIFSRYIINNENNLGWDYGRKIAFQHKSSALVCYTPKTIQQQISSLKLSVLIHQSKERFSIIYDRNQLDVGDEIFCEKPIIIQFKKVLISLIPLKSKKVRIEKIDECIAISMIDYEGEEKYFPKKMLKLTCAGFAFEIRNCEESCMRSFQRFVNNAVCTDTLYANLHTRFAAMRSVSYSSMEALLECRYNPISEGVEYIRINGENII